MDVEHRQLAEQRLGDQLPERADAADLGARNSHRLHRLGRVDARRLMQLDPELAGEHGDRGRALLAAAPAAPVGRGDDESRAVRRGGDDLEHAGREFRGTQVDVGDPLAAHSPDLSAGCPSPGSSAGSSASAGASGS
jgi:hypothetical protein